MNKWMRSLAFIAAIGVTFMACKPEAEANMEEIDQFKQAICASPVFPGGEALTPQSNDTVYREYGPACQEIIRLSGLHFRDAQQAYLCRTAIAYEPLTPQEQASIPDAAKVKERFGEAVERTDLLMVRRMVVNQFGVIVLVNVDGQPFKALANQAEVEENLERVENVEGAAALAYLMGQLGEGYSPQALCNAEVVADENGWTFRKADVWYNCQARQWRDVSVSKTGTVELLKTEDQKDEKGNISAICVD